MIEYSQGEKKMLTQLQRGVEPVSRPFHGLDLPETEVLSVLQRATQDGLLRRFGAVFDSRRLGYKSILCALDIPLDQMGEKVAVVAAHPGVTHCYERFPVQSGIAFPRLWFTLAMRHDEYDRGLATLRGQLAPGILYELPALKRFKIEVVFDLHSRERGETFSGERAVSMEGESFRVFTEVEKELIRRMDQQIPLVPHPFAAIAEQLGQSEAFVLSTLQDWKPAGVLRRIGAILYHREAGFKANAMCVWPVPEAEIVEAGRKVASYSEVTHCYQRPRLDPFPFDLYAMIHASGRDSISAVFQDISATCGLSGGEQLVSGREFKKSSMRYFRED